MLQWRREPKVQQWLASLRAAGCRVKSLRAERIVRRHNGELLFAFLRGDITAPDGHPLPPIALVRGHAVVIVPLVRNTVTGEERFLTVVQRRIGNGLDNVEFPAGMLDREVDDPVGVAVRELREETGLEVAAGHLHPLYNRPLYTSVGLLDEAILFYGAVVDLTPERFAHLEGAEGGAADEHERITVRLHTAAELERVGLSGQVVLGLRLFDEWRKCHRRSAHAATTPRITGNSAHSSSTRSSRSSAAGT